MRHLYLTWDVARWKGPCGQAAVDFATFIAVLKHPVTQKPELAGDVRRVSFQKSKLTSSWHHGDPLAGEYVLAGGRDDNVAVCPGLGCYVTRSLPGHKFNLRGFILAGNNCGEEASEAGFDADLGFELGMQEGERTVRHASQGFEPRPGKQFEGDHGGDRVAWEAEEIGSRVWARTPDSIPFPAV